MSRTEQAVGDAWYLKIKIIYVWKLVWNFQLRRLPMWAFVFLLEESGDYNFY